MHVPMLYTYTHKADFADEVPYVDGIFACVLKKHPTAPDRIKFIQILVRKTSFIQNEVFLNTETTSVVIRDGSKHRI